MPEVIYPDTDYTLSRRMYSYAQYGSYGRVQCVRDIRRVCGHTGERVSSMAYGLCGDLEIVSVTVLGRLHDLEPVMGFDTVLE